jgi:hypothetical protein
MVQEDGRRASIIDRATGGAVLAAIGIAMIVIGWDYPTGRLRQMGPGYVPMAVGVLICAMAALILWFDLTDRNSRPAPKMDWRGLIFISAAILVFAGLVERAGLVPAMFCAVVVSKFADPDNRVLGILIYAVLATLAAWGLFILLLELPIPAFRR